MKRNSSSDAFFARSEQSKKIPVPSQEAYNILSSDNTLANISRIVHRFNVLVHKEKSVLNSYHFGKGRLDNQEFMSNLDDILNRLTDAVTNNEPYATLFGDVTRLKEYLQVILAYYQEQLKKNLPDIKDYETETSQAASPFKVLMSAISQHQKPMIDDEESKVLETYVIKTSAKSIMEADMHAISDVVLMSFLEDHRHDPGFKY